MLLVRKAFIGLLFVSCLLPQLALAATVRDQAPDPVLRQLYLAQLHQKKADPSLVTRIATERARLKKDELKELGTLVEAANAEGSEHLAQGTTALQKQQSLVEILEARRQETMVDLDLLREEQDVLQENATTAKGQALDGVQRRMADLLAKQAALEERLAATDEVLTQQNDRLQRLSAQERTEKFVGAIQIASYVALFVLIIVAERFIRRRLITRISDRNRRYLVIKLFTGTVYILVIGWILYRLSGDYPGFVTSFAIIGAGIAVALQSVIKDIVGWVLIVQKGLFRLGQRVTIGPYTGDVADISLLRTTLVEVLNAGGSTDVARNGQTLYLPNSLVLEGPVLNFHATSDFVDAEIPVTVTYASDWKKAEQILGQILDEEVGQFVERARLQHVLRTAHFFAAQEPHGPRVFVDLAADGILLTLRFQIPIGRKRSIISAITRKILERFAQEKIDPAYRTVQVVNS